MESPLRDGEGAKILPNVTATRHLGIHRSTATALSDVYAAARITLLRTARDPVNKGRRALTAKVHTWPATDAREGAYCGGKATRYITYSRAETHNGAAADDTVKVYATTRDTSGNLDPHGRPAINEPKLPTARADRPKHVAAGAADGSPPNHNGWLGSNPSSAASTGPYPRRAPVNLRVVYRNTGGLELSDFTDTSTIGIRLSSAGTELRLFAVYRPPVSHFRSSDIHTIFDDNTPTILAGDLISKHTAWGSRVVSPAGRQLLQEAKDYGYKVLGPDTSSHVLTDPRFGTDVLDIVLCQRLSFPIHVEVLYDMDTQHLPILSTLDTTVHLTPARPQTHRTNLGAYQRALEELHIGKSFSNSEKVDLAATSSRKF
ncbi:RNA-directed DNA polymerase from mobile element jockey [Eumeta japonica]|uniref:RNA-directed DNA polymerase from mobile element jockey n=1 Tax=Eumeta variegata TaxID=151549 RepID=A0A4C1YZC5_EUMVA|nr:RNA-directed DNA polymerase from mobile element jockey [Eumeta japonica]